MVNLKLLVSIGHPAHVHVFKHLIWNMEKRGHEIKIVARNKDVSKKLLDVYNFDYTLISDAESGTSRLAIEMMVRVKRLLPIVRNFNPNIVLSLLDPSVAIVTKMMRKKYISLHDTEHAKLVNITLPFTDVIFTPSCFKKDLGKKQIRYNGYHELAYLHPNYFTPNPAVLDEIGLSKDDNIFLIRFAAFNASHDTRSKNFKKEYVLPLIKKLEKEGRVIISSETKPDKYLRKYQYKLSPEKYHDVLYYSKMYIGEGSTTAEEAAILGVPSLHFERLNIDGKACGIASFNGVLDELQNKYGLLYSYYSEKELLAKVEEIITNIDTIKKEWKEKREKLLKDKIDVTTFMVWFIENYPESFKRIKANPKIQHRFQSISKESV